VTHQNSRSLVGRDVRLVRELALICPEDNLSSNHWIYALIVELRPDLDRQWLQGLALASSVVGIDRDSDRGDSRNGLSLRSRSVSWPLAIPSAPLACVEVPRGSPGDRQLGMWINPHATRPADPPPLAHQAPAGPPIRLNGQRVEAAHAARGVATMKQGHGSSLTGQTSGIGNGAWPSIVAGVARNA
jgi:hypothetical protein